MKKIFSFLITAFVSINLFAFDATSFIAPAVGVKSYVKTDYIVTSKFGEYFRTPNVKYMHVFNNLGQEIDNKELTVDGKIIDRISYAYNQNGKLVTTACYDNADTLLWKVENVYKNNLKVEENEYDANNNLVSKSIYKYSGDKCIDETYYNANGALIWKNTFAYDDKGNMSEEYSYFENGSLESKKTFKYSDSGKITEICYYIEDGVTLDKKDIYRYDANNVLTEIATYTPENKVYFRQFYKYDARGNISKITSYNIVQKFGTTLNELASMSDFSYQY